MGFEAFPDFVPTSGGDNKSQAAGLPAPPLKAPPTDSGVSRSRPSTSNGTGLLRKVSSSVRSFLVNKPVTGSTAGLTILRAERDTAMDAKWNDEFEVVSVTKGFAEGDIYKMRAKSNKKLFVVKHTRISSYDDKENRGKTPNEAHVLLRLLAAHPRIIRVFKCDLDKRDTTRTRIWMEYCSGGNLHDQYLHWLHNRRSAMPVIFLMHFIIQMTEALAFVHHGLRHTGNGKYTQDADHRSVIHGDVKDDNILIRWPEIPIAGLPELVLADFGTAKRAGNKHARLSPGTMAFNAPEDIAIYGDLKPSPETAEVFHKAVNSRTVASDMYSLGLLAYMYATKDRKPIAIGTDPASLKISREYNDLPGLLFLVQKMLAVKPEERAEASFDPELGILPMIDDLRNARDKLIAQRGAFFNPMEWASPPKTRR